MRSLFYSWTNKAAVRGCLVPMWAFSLTGMWALTHRVAGLARDLRNARALLWNPAGASFEDARCALGAPDGVLAVIGGANVFGLFLEIGYDSFHLSRANNVRLPSGRRLLPQARPDVTPEEILASHGLKPGPEQVLDAAAGVTLVNWSR
jgi:hypothetical protein